MGMCDMVMDARNDVMLQAMNASIEGGVKSEDIKRFTLKHIPNDPMRDNLFFDGELIGVISTEFVNDGENISFKTQFTPS